jgi:hypothetical protein
LLTSSKLFSQTLVLNKKDTTICFNLNQGRYLLKQVYRVKECDTLYAICEAQKLKKDSIIKEQQANVNDLKKVILNQNTLIGINVNLISSLEQKISDSQKDTRKQKLYKWLAIAGGSILSGFITYKYIKK